VTFVYIAVMLKQRVTLVTAAAACTLAATPILASAAPASAAPATNSPTSTVLTSTATASTATIPSGLMPEATSWTTALQGTVLAYPAQTTGAKPYLLQTANGGKSWQSLPAPPLTYPADNDQPDAVSSGDVIVVTDGTHVITSSDDGEHWQTEQLTGASGSFYVDHVAIADGRVFALVSTENSITAFSGAVPASTAKSGALSPVQGLTVTGTTPYGDISVTGGLQIDLASNFTTEKYWYSDNGTSFTAAPLPCPATYMAWLGGVRSGKVIALCEDSPSAIGPGETDAQLQVAAGLGEKFTTSGTHIDIPNMSGFAAASPEAVTAATVGNLSVSANAGTTWTAELPQDNGASWNDLSFPTTTTGFVVCSTVNNSLKEVNTLYRTTNAGKSWSAVPLP
jgi:photosystem II stability/assembly factor-like uncharacterized protein